MYRPIIQFALLIISQGAAFATGSTISCINPFSPVGNQCLYFGGVWSMTHDDSQDICETIGGWLARITSATQHKAIVDYVTASSELDHSYWVDGSDRANNDVWIFSNGNMVPRGTPFWMTEKVVDENNTYIQRPEPDGVGKWMNCLSLQKSFYYFFSDEDCKLELSPLCESNTTQVVQHNRRVAEHRTPGNIIGAILDNDKPTCGGDIVGASGSITSPDYPSGAPDNIDCQYTITINQDLVTPQSYISLSFVDIPGICGALDYVEVRDGLYINSPLLTKCGGGARCVPVNSTGTHMFVRIHTDSDVNTTCGVRVDWRAVNTKCGEDIIGIEGTLQSPSYSGLYFNNLDCQWTITSTPELSTPDTHVILSITKFDTEVGNDYLVIRDGDSGAAPVLANLTGHEVTVPSLHSSGQHLHFYFHTDQSITYEGFTIQWRAEICPSSYMIIGDMCLRFIWSDSSWGEASVSCQADGGQLAEVKQPQQLRDIYLYLHDEGIEEDSFWLGGSDAHEEGFWIWTDGSNVTEGTPFWGLSTASSSSSSDEYEEEEEADNTAPSSWNGIFGILKGHSSSKTLSPVQVQEPDGKTQENCLALLAEGFHFFRDVSCNLLLKSICSHPLH